MDDKVREVLDRQFPANAIKQRPGMRGSVLNYVEGAEYVRRLNEAFVGDWSWRVLKYETIGGREVVVYGELTAGGQVKHAFGGSVITKGRDGHPLSVADDLKSAATDALKKAASLLGVGLHLYSSENASHTPTAPATHKTTKPPQQVPFRTLLDEAPAGPNILTDKQLSAIWAISKKAGMTAEDVVKQVKEEYHKPVAALTKKEASDFIGELKELF